METLSTLMPRGFRARGLRRNAHAEPAEERHRVLAPDRRKREPDAPWRAYERDAESGRVAID